MPVGGTVLIMSGVAHSLVVLQRIGSLASTVDVVHVGEDQGAAPQDSHLKTARGRTRRRAPQRERGTERLTVAGVGDPHEGTSIAAIGVVVHQGAILRSVGLFGGLCIWVF